MSELIYKDESYKIIGACFEVYKLKGIGYTEHVYQECLAYEIEIQGVPFVSQPELEIEYKGRILKQTFKPDFICFGKIVIELKALEKLVDPHSAQVLNYLNATGFDLGLLVNFGHFPRLESNEL